MTKTAQHFAKLLKNLSVRLLATGKVGTVRIRVYDALGKVVATFQESKPLGSESNGTSASSLVPGVYFYHLEHKNDSGNSRKIGPRKFVVAR